MEEIKNYIKYYLFSKKDKNLNKEKKCLIFFFADYGNLGDVAISYSQMNFLKSVFPTCKIYKYSLKDSIYYLKNIKKFLTKDDIITFVGGGNFGDTYLPFENARRFIVKKLKKYRIYSFPQTIFYENKLELNISQQIYNNSNLLIYTRENKSYSTYKNLFNNVKLVPDIVLANSLKVNYADINNNHRILLLFRLDIEKKGDNIDKIKDMLTNNGYEYDESSTMIDINDGIDLFKELNDFLAKICSYNCIITDRLHAMIFSYLLNKKVVAFNNFNDKIKSTYETWFSNSENILYLDNIIEKDILMFLEKSETNIKEEEFSSQFEVLKNDLMGAHE